MSLNYKVRKVLRAFVKPSTIKTLRKSIISMWPDVQTQPVKIRRKKGYRNIWINKRFALCWHNKCQLIFAWTLIPLFPYKVSFKYLKTLEALRVCQVMPPVCHKLRRRCRVKLDHNFSASTSELCFHRWITPGFLCEHSPGQGKKT